MCKFHIMKHVLQQQYLYFLKDKFATIFGESFWEENSKFFKNIDERKDSSQKVLLTIENITYLFY